MSSLMSGYIDRCGRMVVPNRLRTAEPFVDSIAKVTEFGSWGFGFMDPAGEWIVAPGVSDVDRWTDSIRAFATGGQRDPQRGLVGAKWGWLGGGRVRVTPTFDDVGRPGAGLIPIQQQGRWGFADYDGNVRIAPAFERVDAFDAGGVAPAAEGGRWGYIGLDGQWRISPRFEATGPWSGGRGRIKMNGRWHLCDDAGTPLGEGYDDVLPVMGSMAEAIRGQEHWLLDVNGQPVVGRSFQYIAPFSDPIAACQAGRGEWYFVTARGQTFGPYTYALAMTHGLARFDPGDAGDGLGFLDAQGRTVIAPRYESARGFIEGFAAVKRQGKWTFVRPDGAELMPPRFELVGDFGDGVAPVREGGKWALIDTAGNLLFSPTYDSIDTMASGRAAARRVSWPAQISVPNTEWHAVPAEGLTHPGFAGAGPNDELRVTVCFHHTPADEQSLAMQQLVGNWLDLCEANAPGRVLVGDRPWIADYAISLRFGGVDDPVKAANLLVGELAGAGLPIKELDVARFRDDTRPGAAITGLWGGKPAVPHPDDPGGSDFFPDSDTYLDAAFDLSSVPPASESKQHLLAGRWDQRAGRMILDERTFSLHAPDIRICYGVAQSGFGPGDGRTESLAAALTETLAKRFDPKRMWVFPGARDVRPPAPLTRDGTPGIERIHVGDRTGYCFGIEACDVLQDIGPDCLRYREPELFEAICAVIRRFELAPVLTWQRFGDPLPGPAMPGVAHPMHPKMYVMNLWER